MIYIYLVIFILTTAIAGVGRYLFFLYGIKHQKEKALNAENEILKNRPRTMSDVRKRLQDYINSKD